MDRHASDPAAAAPPRRLLETGRGSRPGSFGPTEWLLLASVALIWGSSYLFIDIGLEALQPGVITVARVALGGAALALVPAARRPIRRGGRRRGGRAVARVALGGAARALVPAARRPIGGEDRPRVVFLGVIWAGLPLLLFPVAQQWIDSSVAGMLNGAVPLAGAAWAVLLVRRPLPRTHAIGLLVGFAGVLAVSWPELQGSRATMLGAGLVILAVLCYGLAVNLAVPLQQRPGALPVLL